MDRLLPWLRRSGVVYLAIALALAALAWRVSLGGGGHAQPESPSEAEAIVEDDAASARVVVHVAGAVRKPGIYELPFDARVHAAVRRAGGPTPRANVAGINLAATITDGQQIVVPIRVQSPDGAASPTSSGPISLSSASVAELESLDGVGPTLAARIVEWRRSNGGFSSVDQLVDVPGIGEGRLEALRGKVAP